MTKHRVNQDQSFSRTCRYFSGLCTSNIPRYFLDCACVDQCACKIIKTNNLFCKFRPRGLYRAKRKRYRFLLLDKYHGVKNFIKECLFLLYYHFCMEDSSESFACKIEFVKQYSKPCIRILVGNTSRTWLVVKWYRRSIQVPTIYLSANSNFTSMTGKY